MIKVGITGGIGSGKSAVCDIWQSLGAYIINADDIAKIIMVESTKVKKEIIQAFGKKSYHPDGSLNRKFLAQQAFEKDRVEELNAIVHPYIPNQVNLLMQNAEEKGVALSVYEAALLLKNHRPENLDYTVLVLADEEKRIQRVKQRDEVDRGQVIDRINKQQNFSELTHLADLVIENNGTLEQLEQKAEQLYYKFLNAKTA